MTSSPAPLRDILAILDKEAPFSLAEPWDNVGLLIGDPSQEISAILIGLDPTEKLLDEASQKGANLIITHHPALFHPLKSIRTDQPTGRFLAKSLKNNIAVIGCHTNLDVIEKGVSQALAEKIGLSGLSPLVETRTDTPGIGFGKIGLLQPPENRDLFLQRLCTLFDLTALKICGDLPETVSRVAVCGGSGSDLAEAALAKGAQVYITGEVKHATARWAEESGLCIIDAGHYATENMIVDTFAHTLSEKLAALRSDTRIFTSNLQKNPFFYYLKQG